VDGTDYASGTSKLYLSKNDPTGYDGIVIRGGDTFGSSWTLWAELPYCTLGPSGSPLSPVQTLGYDDLSFDFGGPTLWAGPGGPDPWGGYYATQDIDNFSAGPVPEPTTMLLFGAGLVGIAGFGRKKFKK